MKKSEWERNDLASWRPSFWNGTEQIQKSWNVPSLTHWSNFTSWICYVCKRCLKMPVLSRTYIFFATHKAYFNFSFLFLKVVSSSSKNTNNPPPVYIKFKLKNKYLTFPFLWFPFFIFFKNGGGDIPSLPQATIFIFGDVKISISIYLIFSWFETWDLSIILILIG